VLKVKYPKGKTPNGDIPERNIRNVGLIKPVTVVD